MNFCQGDFLTMIRSLVSTFYMSRYDRIPVMLSAIYLCNPPRK